MGENQLEQVKRENDNPSKEKKATKETDLSITKTKD